MPKNFKRTKAKKPSAQIPKARPSSQSPIFDSDKHTGEMFIERINQSDREYQKWENRFKCAKLEEYYEGRQWKDQDNYEPYVLNLFFSTIEIKNPALLFRNPNFYCTPTPGSYNFDPNTAFDKASLSTDTLNTVFSNPAVDYGVEIQYALLESMFRFGLVEVGYDAKWISNPNSPKPIHEDQYESELKGKKDTTVEPDQIPEEEWVYIKSIQAHRVRVGGWSSKTLSKANWVAYYEYLALKDLQDPGLGLRNIDQLELSSASNQSADISLDENEDQDGTGYGNANTNKGNLRKFWHIFDNRKKVRYLVDEGTKLVVKETPYPGAKGKQRLPLHDLRFSLRPKGWLPVPYTYNWKSPQDEQNETLEQLRAARRRTKRLFQMVGESIEEEEQDKLLSGPDGSIIKTKQMNALSPIEWGRLDPVVGTSLQLSKENFLTVSGSTTEDQGQSDRVTATQANITNTRASIRENKDRDIVAGWLCGIAREVLLIIIEKFTLPLWVKLNSDSTSVWGEAYPEIQNDWKQLKADSLEGIDYRVAIEVDTMSPVANEIEKNKFLNFMAVMNQFPQLALNPLLIREAAFRLDYRNEKVIKAFQQAAILQMMGQVSQAGGNPGNVQPPNTPMAQRTAEQQMPPNQAQMENQLANQGVPQ